MTLAAILETRSEAIGIVRRRVARKKHVLNLLLRQASFSKVWPWMVIWKNSGMNPVW